MASSAADAARPRRLHFDLSAEAISFTLWPLLTRAQESGRTYRFGQVRETRAESLSYKQASCVIVRSWLRSRETASSSKRN